jgi:hypothetical protein
MTGQLSDRANRFSHTLIDALPFPLHMGKESKRTVHRSHFEIFIPRFIVIVGGGLGKLWVRAGHQVFFSSRHPNRLKALVEEAGPGAYSGNVADAALFGDVILFSPNFWSVDDALEATGPLKGKTVVDVTNPLEWSPTGRMVRSLPDSTTAGEQLAKKIPDARVVKAFSTIPRVFHSLRLLQTRSTATFSRVLLRRSLYPESRCSPINYG